MEGQTVKRQKSDKEIERMAREKIENDSKECKPFSRKEKAIMKEINKLLRRISDQYKERQVNKEIILQLCEKIECGNNNKCKNCTIREIAKKIVEKY